MNLKNLSTINISILNWLFLLIPFTHILGSFAINLNVILLCLFGLITFNKKIIDKISFRSISLILGFFLILIFFSFKVSNSIGNESGFLKNPSG